MQIHIIPKRGGGRAAGQGTTIPKFDSRLVSGSGNLSGHGPQTACLLDRSRPKRIQLPNALCVSQLDMRSSLLMFVCLLAGTSPRAQIEARGPVIKQARPPDCKPQYFPAGLFSNYPVLSDWEARWYASELRGLKEPSLLEGKIKRGTTAYRFLLIPSFSPSLVIRLVLNSDGTGTLVAKLGANYGEADKTSPRQQTVSVSSEQVNKFLNLIHDADFWSMPTAKSNVVAGADGQEWLLEARQNDRYHVVDRWNGLMETSFSRACNYLQELSALKVELPRRKRATIQQPITSPD